MRSFNRGQALNLVYHAGSILLGIMSIALFVAKLWLPAMLAAAACVAWVVGLLMLGYLYEPALLRWVNYGEETRQLAD